MIGEGQKLEYTEKKVQIVVTFDSFNTIRMYRNGLPYGDKYKGNQGCVQDSDNSGCGQPITWADDNNSTRLVFGTRSSTFDANTQIYANQLRVANQPSQYRNDPSMDGFEESNIGLGLEGELNAYFHGTLHR